MDAVTPKAQKSAEQHSHVVRPANMEWQKTRFAGCEVKTLLFDRETGLVTALMRLAPVVLHGLAISELGGTTAAVEQSKTTHGAQACLDSCGGFAFLRREHTPGSVAAAAGNRRDRCRRSGDLNEFPASKSSGPHDPICPQPSIVSQGSAGDYRRPRRVTRYTAKLPSQWPPS